jgi:DHA1 family tetracycline resistance protein-like MFS transporter
MAVLALDYVVMAVAGSIWLLLGGRVIAGMAAATHATALAFMADITEPGKRAQNFGLISAGFGMGFILGPLLGGLLGDLDPRAPFVAAAILSGLNFLFGWLVLPESLPRERRRAFDWRRANPAGGLMKIGELPGVAPASGGDAGLPDLELRLSRDLGLLDANDLRLGREPRGRVARGLWRGHRCRAGGLIRAVLPRLGEVRAVCWGLILNTACLVIYGLISEGWMIWVMIPISAVGAIVAPAMQGVMSRAAGADQQGELQGVLASISALSMVLSPLMMTQAFFWATREGGPVWLPGAPFLLSAMLMATALAIFLGTGRARAQVTPAE